LRHYPGPRLWAISRLPWLSATVKGTIIHDLQELHRQYGPVVRVAPDELSYIAPDATKAIYQSNPEFPKDPMHLPPFHNGVPGILAADHANHRRYRRLLAGSFSDKGIRAQQHMIQQHIDLLMRRLSERSGPDAEPQDMCEWYNWCTFDIIGDLAFGESFGCLANTKTHDWIASIQGNVKAIPVVNAIRRLGLTSIVPLLAPKRLLEMRRRNAEFTEDRVDRRRAHGSAARGDLWDGVMRTDAPDKHDEQEGMRAKESGMTRDEMISNASAIVLAGSETSATLLSGCTWFLLRNPEILASLAESVRSAFSSEAEIDLLSVGKLDYMLAVLDESLRLYPPVPMQSNRIVTAGGATIAGRWVPEGVRAISFGPALSVALDVCAAWLTYFPCRLPWRYNNTRPVAHRSTSAGRPSSSPTGGSEIPNSQEIDVA